MDKNLFPPKSDTWCSALWTHQFISPGGQVKPCCRYKLNDKHSHLHNATLGDIFWGQSMDLMRRSLWKGERLEGCQRCYEEEESQKGKSLRQIYNSLEFLPPERNLQDQPSLKWIELALSNECNLKCRMCDSRYSSFWFDEEKRVFGQTWSQEKRLELNLDQILPYLGEVVHIKFTGGEPLMIKNHYKLLEHIVNSGRASDIYLNYSTNCTIFPSTRLKGLWKKFKRIELALSIDALGEKVEYIRHPSKWSQIESVAKELLSLHNEVNCKVGLRSTVSLLNIYELPWLFDWWGEIYSKYYQSDFSQKSWFNPTHLTYPRFLDARVLPENFKKKVIEHLLKFRGHEKMVSSIHHFVRFISSQDLSSHLPEFIQFTKKLDQSRKESFDKVFPHFKGLLETCK